MKVDYYFSVASPFSYLAIERFSSLIKKYNLDVVEKPFDLVGTVLLILVVCLYQKDIPQDKSID